MRAPKTSRRLRMDSERGTAALEVLILAPVLFIMIDIAIYAGCVVTAHAIAHRAAEAGVRGRSVARTGRGSAQGGDASNNLTAGANVSPAVIYCVGSQIDTRPFAVPVGTPSTTTFTVTCSMTVPGITIPGLPQQINVSETETSVLDTYRGRS